MDKGYEKKNLETYRGVLENTVKMYDATLREMEEKKSKQDAISLVLEMKRATKDEIEKIDKALLNLENGDKAGFVFAFNELMEKFNELNPYTRNRFLVDFETDDVKDYYVESASYTEDRLIVRFRNGEGFFAPEYFQKNKKFENIRLFLLNPINVKKAMITFYDAKVKCCQMDTLNYSDDGVLCTEVVFTFKKVIHCSNVNKIEKDPQ